MGSNFFTAKLSWLSHLPSFFNYGEQKRRQTKFKQKISPQRISSLYTGPVGLHSALRLQYLSFGLNSKLQQSVVLSQCSEQVSMSLMETICLIPVPGTSPAILMYGFGHAERKAMLRGDSGVQNMRERGSTAPRHFFILPGTFY